MRILKLIKKNSLLPVLFVILWSCDYNNGDDDMITESVGSAEYFINNQMGTDIILIYRKSEELGFEPDTTHVIERNTSIKILEDGIIGVNPVPENSFSEIKIYESSDLNNPIKILSPVKNDDWSLIDQDLGSSGYGLSTYEMKLTN